MKCHAELICFNSEYVIVIAIFLHVCTGLFMIYEEFHKPKYRLVLILLFKSDNAANNDGIAQYIAYVMHSVLYNTSD